MTRKFSTTAVDGVIYTDKNGKILRTQNESAAEFIKKQCKHLETSIHNLMNKNPNDTFTEFNF